MINVLIVDDLASKCKMLNETYFADKYDIKVDCATSYRSAVKLSEENKFFYQLVICDLNLPTEDPNEKCSGKNLYDQYHKNYPQTIFFLYTEYPNTIVDNDTRAVCISTDSLAQRIPAAVEYLCQPKNDDEKPQVAAPMKGDEIMSNQAKVDWFKFVPITVLILTVVGGYSVQNYKVNSTDCKVAAVCKDFSEYKKEIDNVFESIKINQQATNISVARMDEKLTALIKSMDELSKELKRNRTKLEPY